ncbi:SusC/RagA family TonB-linked outer membrane protein [Pseudoflavitalea sp. X16]|uniref:SusC/RagA family TonB-linked outer membrane protein n=1 Tax=Paraflavitalea devenefica TaxID=2716334 RepID=UPI00141ED02D|nr:SusC/RagA family TonB-linked outer membrane protein [Paraflavitalea devenefica]NII23563.1 SusC/RagA family TonB-linked outer membrane protein [Paraflavitalea devenefica]
MKLTAFLLTAAFLNVSAKAVSQNITFTGQHVSLESVFAAVKKQTGYLFLYPRAALRAAKPVSVSAQDLPLEKFLAEVFRSQPLEYNIKGKNIFVSLKPTVTGSSNQQRSSNVALGMLKDTLIHVTGSVTNDQGKPLSGANIFIRRTGRGTTSDPHGNFTIEASTGDILIISFIGYDTREVKISSANAGTILLKLKPASLGDVIVTTAYGIEKRTKELGYAVAKVKGEDINRTNPGNFLSGLVGKVSGLNISSLSPDMTPDNNIMLRGIRSINQSANNQPLFILNGSPLSFGADQNSATLALDFLNNLNPNDIQDITVLKGANGAALYGPEGVNGVIIITTKRGDKEGLKIGFRSSTAFQYIDFSQRKVQTQFGAGNLTDAQGNPVYNPVGAELWGPAFNNELVPLGRPDENGETQQVPYRYSDDRQQFWDVARITQSNLSISQSDNKSDFYLGLSYTDQTGLLPGDKQNKVGILLNTGRQFNKWNVRINLGYTLTNADKGPSSIKTDMTPPHVPLTSYKDFINDHWADRNHYWADETENPYETIASNRRKSTENALTGNLDFTIKPLKWLTITERPGITYSASYTKATNAPRIYSDFAKAYGAMGRWVSYRDIPARLSEETLTSLAINNDLLLTGLHNAGSFSFRTTLGNTIRQNYTKEVIGSTSYLVIPVYNLAYGRMGETFPREKSVLSRFYSLFSTFSVGYRDMVFLELTGRNDWDSKLAVTARNKNFYSGANTSIVLSEMIPALSKMKWLSSARLRASVTRTANMNIRPYQTERILDLYRIYGDLVSYIYKGNNPNPFIKPENLISQEYGGSFSFLNQHINLDITYYKQRNNGLILDVVNSLYSGAPTIDNAGVYDNMGWEFDVKINRLFKAGHFQAGMDIRLALNDNKVISLPPVYNNQLMAYVGPAQVIARTGHHAFEFNLTDWRRTPDGKIIVNSATGMPELDYANPVFTGRTLPRYSGAANLNLEWKKLKLYLLGEFRGGNHQYNGAGSLDTRMGWSPLTVYNNREPFVLPNSVYDDGSGKYVENTAIKITAIRDFYQNYASSASIPYLVKADFFKLREISLTYDLTLKIKPVKNILLGVYGRDIASIYAKGNFYGDPLMVRGPGWSRGMINPGGESNLSNVAGAAANETRLPGTIMYGFVVNVGF